MPASQAHLGWGDPLLLTLLSDCGYAVLGLTSAWPWPSGAADEARSYRSRLRRRRSRGGSAGAADGEDPGGLVAVTIVAPPGSRTTVWNDPSGSWVVVDPSALTMEYFSAPSAVVPVVAPGPAAGSAVGAGGLGGWAGSAATVQAAGSTGVVGAPGSAGSVEGAGAVQASGSATAGVVCDAVWSDPAVGGSHSAPGPKKKPAGLSSGSLMARIITL